MKRRIAEIGLIALVALTAGAGLVYAQADRDVAPAGIKKEVDDLNAQIVAKEKNVRELEKNIAQYKNKAKQYEQAVTSLRNEVALLENRMVEKRLAVERTKQQIEIVALEIQSLVGQIKIEEAGIVRREAGLADVIRKMAEADRVTSVDVLIAQPSLSEFFVRLDQLNRVEQGLVGATLALKESKFALEGKKGEREMRSAALQDQKSALQREERALAGDRAAKITLLSESQDTEQEFQRILYELRQQQQKEADDVAALQNKLKDKLDSVDTALARGDILLNWPVRAWKGLSAGFHDPTYPFRKMFEHPGVDVPTDVGTPVRAAAGGYVAWNRTGKQYGNYAMLVHPGGIATVYAHLSRFGAQPDTYVERGDVIGYSGGRPGDQGAGLSTGPHLHFEVRQGGIPVNPMQYLAGL